MKRTSLAVLALLAAAGGTVCAQEFKPTKPIRFIAPFAPGGGTDFIARVAAQKLTEAVKVQVIVDNRPGAGGQGSIVHLSTELFLHMAAIKAVHIPYKGTGPAMTDTMAGNTQFLFGSIAAVMPIVKQGRLRGIAVTTAKRIPALPDIPTIAESGVKGYDVILWHGLIGPKGLPRPIVDRVNGVLNNALKAKDMEEKLATDGVTAAGGKPEQFAALIKRDIDTWRKVVQTAGVKAE